MLGLRAYLAGYVASAGFRAMVEETKAIRRRLWEVRYTVRIVGGRVHVARYAGEADHSAEVLALFERFKQGDAKGYRTALRGGRELNRVEALVLELVARLHPEAFAELDAYCQRHRDHLDPTIRRFDREVQLYLAYLAYLAPLRDAGLPFCYPEVTRESKEVLARGAFDLVLAARLRADGRAVVGNDLELSGSERVIVVSGPNQGGKTTFARTFGQLHHLACLAFPVPGTSARLWCFDQLFTQFGREEDLANLAGKLEDDLRRVQDILARSTPRSIVVLNETSASTSLEAATVAAAEPPALACVLTVAAAACAASAAPCIPNHCSMTANQDEAMERPWMSMTVKPRFQTKRKARNALQNSPKALISRAIAVSISPISSKRHNPKSLNFK